METYQKLVRSKEVALLLTTNIIFVLAGTIGFCCFIGLAYAQGLHTKSNLYVGVWPCTILVALGSHAIRRLFETLSSQTEIESTIKEEEEPHRLPISTYLEAAFALLMFILSFILLITGSINAEAGMAVHSLMWMLPLTTILLLIYRQRQHGPPQFKRSIPRIFLAIATGFFLFNALLWGVLIMIQSANISADKSSYPPPGTLYNIPQDGGQVQMHMHCTGTQIRSPIDSLNLIDELRTQVELHISL